ncbi:Uncharacterised protein [Mycobacteroides abscessus subsp. massiliense]|nr:Uncharacterised protein [Mycobacteroides abscessus subsp. massiliense]
MFKPFDDFTLIIDKDKVTMFTHYFQYNSSIYCITNFIFTFDINLYTSIVTNLSNCFYEASLKVFTENSCKHWWCKWIVVFLSS